MKILKKICIQTPIYARAHTRTHTLSLSLFLFLCLFLSHTHTHTFTAFFAKNLTTTSEVCTSCIGIAGMYLSMFVCLLVCMHLFMYLCLFVCMFVCVCMYVRWYIGMHSFASICLCFVYMCVYMHARSMHACTYIVFIFFRVCEGVCWYACLYECMYDVRT